MSNSALPIVFLLPAVALVASSLALADIVLPYTARTHQYSAWGTTVLGDLGTVGMAGAMVGLADSRIGSVDNPAGLPLTLDSTGIQVTGNSFQDGYIQSYPSLINTSSTVVTFCPYPWGASFASFSPSRESDTYQVAGAAEAIEVKTREYHFSAANLYLGNRLSVGLSFILAENDQSFTPTGGGTLSHTAWGFGASMGALYVLPYRLLAGVSYTPPIHYAMSAQGDVNPSISGFFQDAAAPYRLGLGLGWIPNRLFRASAALYVFGSTDNTALVSDDSRLVGVNLTLQPRFGLSYRLIEFKDFVVNLAAGAYLEVMREQDDFSRLHGTIALEVKPWVLTFGWGLDEARFYQNFIYSAGVDVGRVLRKLDLIPRAPRYPYGGVLPDPTHLSDEGLSHALDSRWQKRDDNAIDVGLKMPGKLRDRIVNAPEQVKEIGTDLMDSFRDLKDGVSEDAKKVLPKKEQQEAR